MVYKMSRLTVICAICISTLLFVPGCNKKDEFIRIGIIGTMSGVNSDLSVSGRRGVETAVDEINKAGGLKGKKIQLVIKDDMNDSSRASIAYKEFVNEKIAFVIGPYTSGMILNSIDYIRNNNILVLGPTISADALSNTDDNFIRFIASTKEQAVVLTDMAKKNNHKKFAIIYDLENKGFNDALYSNFKKQLESNQGEVIITETFSSNSEVDYSGLAKDIAESKAEAVLIIANSSNNAKLCQQLRKLGCKVQVYSPLWSNTSDIIKKGGTSVEGMYIVGGIDLNNKSNDFVEFKKNYIDKYGENPTFSSVYSYEAVKVLVEAMKMGPDYKPPTIKRNMLEIHDFEGLQSNYQIDKFGDNTRKYMVLMIEKEQLRKVD